jgi:hypothetical protein
MNLVWARRRERGRREMEIILHFNLSEKKDYLSFYNYVIRFR